MLSAADTAVAVAYYSAVYGAEVLTALNPALGQAAASMWHPVSEAEGDRIVPHYEDLSPYTYWPEVELDPGAVAVGWLAEGHGYPVGDVPAGFVECLTRLAAQSPVHRTRGWQACPFCVGEYPIQIPVDGVRMPVGDAEIRIATDDGRTYFAPTLIVHFVAAHGYLPPDEFIDAVLQI